MQPCNQSINRSINQSINLADTTGDGGASSPPARAVDSAGTKATLGESRPDLASVGTTGESTVSIEDGVTGLDEGGVARLAVVGVSVLLEGSSWEFGLWVTYRAIPSMTSFMARYFPSVGTPFLMVGRAASFLPSLSIRFHRTVIDVLVNRCWMSSGDA